MAAYAMLLNLDDCVFEGGTWKVSMLVRFVYGTAPNFEQWMGTLEATWALNANIQTVSTAMTDAMVAYVVAQNWGHTLAKQDIMFQAFSRG